jgi:hypothetical protein
LKVYQITYSHYSKRKYVYTINFTNFFSTRQDALDNKDLIIMDDKFKETLNGHNRKRINKMG